MPEISETDAKERSKDQSIFDLDAQELMTALWAEKRGFAPNRINKEYGTALFGVAIRLIVVPILVLIALIAFGLIFTTDWNSSYLAWIAVGCIILAIVLFVVGTRMYKRSPLGEELDKDLIEFENLFKIKTYNSTPRMVLERVSYTLVRLHMSPEHSQLAQSGQVDWVFDSALASARKFFRVDIGADGRIRLSYKTGCETAGK